MRYQKLILLTALLSSLSGEARVIYGEDNRIEVYQGAPFQQRLALGAAVLIPNSSISRDSSVSGRVQIAQTTLAEWLQNQMNEQEKKAEKLLTFEVLETLESHQTEINFCPTVKFTQQPSVGQCSGFLIGPDLLLTAGHCSLEEDFCAGNSWVFDYKVDEDSQKAGVDHPEHKIYQCKRVISSTLTMSLGLDYSLIQLDRPVKDRMPLLIQNEKKVSDDASLMVIGSPSGLPLKIAPGGKVRENEQAHYFTTNLDSFQGNSGSAVFNAATGMVEGILVRGEQDFKLSREGKCLESNVCDDEGCRGEDVTRLTAVPEIGIQAALNKASLRGDLPTLEGLLKLQTWVDFYSHDGQTALIKAAQGKSVKALELLLASDADPNHQDANGNGPLHHLSRKLDAGTRKNLEVLLGAMAKLELRNIKGETPLLIAAREQNLAGVKLLIEQGADRFATDLKGDGVLSHFKKKNDKKALAELQKLGLGRSTKFAAWP